MTALLKRGEHKYARKEWLNDTLEDVVDEIKAKGVTDNSDVRVMLLGGENRASSLQGTNNHARTSLYVWSLEQYYAHGFRTMQPSLWLSSVVKHITDRQLASEIDAGTGGATKASCDRSQL
ncbi:hypothetical protein MMC08_000099 [Hypocenomyce scalaris]|nr:hypothetical protein [Hypocenomyce scalaris]